MSVGNRVLASRFSARVNESTTIIQAAPATGNINVVTSLIVRCNTATTFGIYDNTTTSILMEIELSASEGLVKDWNPDNPLAASTNSTLIFRLLATGTVSDINYEGYSYIPGR